MEDSRQAVSDQHQAWLRQAPVRKARIRVTGAGSDAQQRIVLRASRAIAGFLPPTHHPVGFRKNRAT